VAREALSACLDGERQQVPAARVDAHVESCSSCRQWLAEAAALRRRTRQAELNTGPDLSSQIVAAADALGGARLGRSSLLVSRLIRCGLAGTGVAMVAVAVAQAFGADFGMVDVGHHGAGTGMHLLHESTAWSMALGCAMVVASIWPRAALGVGAVLGVFVTVLVGYVIGDAWIGQVTAIRIASHAPAILGLALVLLVCRDEVGGRRLARATRVGDQDIILPAGANRGRRRGHVRPVDHSAA
jgi:RNA polymerase sigma-70 factor, ECF subfamily